MKKHIFVITLVVLSIVVLINLNKSSVKETITFFPIDPNATYKSTYTTLMLGEKTDAEQFSMQWRIGSILDRQAYLRQDIGLLYDKGRLAKKMGKWEQNTDRVELEEKFFGKESSYYQAISFHHSEIHYDTDQIGSAQRMSGDELYIVDSKFSPLQSFRLAKTKEEKEWKKVLDQTISQTLQASWTKAKRTFSIKDRDYYTFPLSDIKKYNNEPLPSFTNKQTEQIIGRLWEGLYKNYFLGIKKQDGSVVDPIDSTIPLIMIAKDQSHLLVIFETKDGESIMLRQQIKVR